MWHPPVYTQKGNGNVAFFALGFKIFFGVNAKIRSFGNDDQIASGKIYVEIYGMY